MPCDAVELHSLLDDVVTRLRHMGRAVFAAVRRRMFVVGRIVPVHPASDAWLVSGHFTAFPKSAPREIAEAAAGEIIRHPELLRRNPALLRQAWEIQADHRMEFIA